MFRVEVYLWYCSPSRPLLHLIAALRVPFQVDNNKRYLQVSQQLFGSSAERATGDGVQKYLTEEHHIEQSEYRLGRLAQVVAANVYTILY